MRYAVRSLLRAPGFTAVAVISLALGIGGNTLMFSIVQAVLIRALPYPESDRLVFVWFTPPNHPEQKRAATTADFIALRERSRMLEHVGTMGGVGDTASFAGAAGENTEEVEGQRFSAGVPRALGATTLLGRWFTEAEAETEAVVVISYRLWQRRFGGSPDVLGRTVRTDGKITTILGVMPEGWMLFNNPVQFWMPERLDAGSPDRNHPLAARLKAGVTLRQAQQEMNSLAAGLGEKGWGIRLEPALEIYVGWVRRPLLIVQGVVALVLLIACANVAGLLLARAAARKKEVAVRSALGAGRWQIARLFLTESLLLSVYGGLCGAALAYGGLKLFRAISPAWFPRVGEIGLDAGVLGLTAMLSVATGLVFGAIPAMEASRGGMSRQRVRGVLVMLEVSAALVLVTGAGLMLNTFLRLYNAPTGCDPRNLITFQVRLPSSPRVHAAFEQIRRSISGIAGVRSAAAGIRPPLSEGALGGLTLPVIVGSKRMDAALFPVSAGYFRTLGVRLVRGREFGVQDGPSGVPAALINEAMARRFWPGEDPIGKRLRIDRANEPNREIVGVVGDIRHNRYDREAPAQMYVPYIQQPAVSKGSTEEPRRTMTFAVRTEGDPLRLMPALRAAASQADGNPALFNVRTLDEYVAEQLWQPRQTMTLLGVFGGIAVMLALTGVYGIMAYTVRQRTREIGIRMALGAKPLDVLRLVMARGLLLVAVGVTAGAAGSLVFARLLESLLWGVKPTDPPTYAAAILALACSALLACYLPARRAVRVEPTIALRHE